LAVLESHVHLENEFVVRDGIHISLGLHVPLCAFSRDSAFAQNLHGKMKFWIFKQPHKVDLAERSLAK
jgi:hypothetical protein